MRTYTELQEIVDTTIGWEKNIHELYEVAQFGVRNKETKKTVDFLKESHEMHMEVLQNINVENYGPTEWVKFSGEYSAEDIIPNKAISKDSSSAEIFMVILEYEKNLKDFYTIVLDHLNTEKQKELFQSLVTFKENQINRIQNSMERQS